ncbi:hypothetical protein MBANPS3_006904 [Mucor bainieri]
MPGNPTSKSDASRIQSSQAKNNQDTGKGSFASRAQSAADRNANQSGGANTSGGQAGQQQQQNKYHIEGILTNVSREMLLKCMRMLTKLFVSSQNFGIIAVGILSVWPN